MFLCLLMSSTTTRKEYGSSRPAAGHLLLRKPRSVAEDMGGEVDHREFIVYHQNRAVPVAPQLFSGTFS